MLKKINETLNFIQSQNHCRPRIGIILGTGLGGLTKEISVQHSIPYRAIPHFPVSTVPGHEGQLIFGTLQGKEVLAMQGRFHYYEGYSIEEVTFPIKIMKYIGIELLILSNASGGLNPKYEIGDCMFLSDHINLMGQNPLIGPNDDRLGPRFLDMKEAYDKSLLMKALKIAKKYGVPSHSGVYAAVSGPTFETPAEYKYIRRTGADAVGMSTVPEVIVARHMGMKVLAISVITDLGVPGKIVAISHEDVIAAATKSEPMMTHVIKELIEDL